MIADVEEQLDHMVLRGITWGTFERILNEIGDAHHRITYSNSELELFSLPFGHQHANKWIGNLVFMCAVEFGMLILSGGSTTLKQSFRSICLEPDECFWIQHEGTMSGKKEWNAVVDPPPDLAVEVDLRAGCLDRIGILAALKVPEVWRFDGETL